MNKLTLKKFKSFAAMTRETLCFTADVYLDGELLGTAENDGGGASTFLRPAKIYPRTKVERFEQALKEAPPVYDFPEDPTFDTASRRLEDAIDEVAWQAHYDKDRKRDIAKYVKKGWLIIHNNALKMITPQTESIRANLKNTHPGERIIVNDLPPAEALEACRKYM